MVRDYTVKTRVTADVSDFNRAMASARSAVRGLNDEIDKGNDRTTWMVQGLAAIGPALVPIGAALVPVMSGLITQATLAAGAVGTIALAFNGVGDALKAVNEYQLDPTVAHLEKMQEELAKIGPAGAEFVAFLDAVGPQFSALQTAAREGMLPGVEEGIRELLDLLPELESVVTGISEAMGTLATEAGDGLSGEGFADFFDWLEANAKPLLLDLGRSLGNFAEGFAAMMVAFDPLTQSFSDGLLRMSRSFAEWAHGLDESSTFHDFIAYVQQSAPMVLKFFGQLVDMFVALVEAAAPVGDRLLPVLGTLLDIIGAIAATPLGPVLIAITAISSAIGRIAALGTLLSGGVAGKLIFAPLTKGITTAASSTALAAKSMGGNLASLGAIWATAGARTERESNRIKASTKGLGMSMGATAASAARLGAPIAGLGLMMTGLADDTGVANTASLALLGALAPGPWGIVAGGLIGSFLDIKSASDESADAMERWRSSLDQALTAGNLGAGTNILTQARDDYVKFKNEIESGDLSNYMSAVSNSLSGLFGDSQVEQQAAELADLRAEFDNTEGAARALAAAMGIDITGSAVDQFNALQQVMQAAQPTMDTLGLSWEGLAASFAARENGSEDSFWFESSGLLTFNEQLALIKTNAGGAAKNSGRMAREIAEGFEQAATAAERFTIAMQAANAALDGRANMRDYEAAIDAATQALKDNGKTLDIHTEKGRANQAALDGIANVAIEVAEGMGRIEGRAHLAKAREAFIDMAVDMGMARDAARRLANEVGLVGDTQVDLNLEQFDRKINQAIAKLQIFDRWKANPKADLDAGPFAKVLGVSVRSLRDFDSDKAKPGVQLDADAFNAAVSAARRRLAGLDGDEAHTYVYTHFRQTGSGPGQASSPNDGGADGLTVPGPRYPYRDSKLIWAAPTEEVVSNRYGGADKNRAELKAASRGAKLTILRGMANGGTVDSYINGPGVPNSYMTNNSMFGDVSLQRLLRALAQVTNENSKWAKQLGKELDKRIKLFEKEVELAEKQAAADKERLDAMKEASKAFSEQVGGLFRSNVFEKSEAITELPSDWASMSDADRTAWYAEEQRKKALGSVTALQGDIGKLRQALALYNVLAERGFDGPAFRDLVGQADVEQLQYFVSLSDKELAGIEKLYKQRDKLAQQVGDFAANSGFGKEIHALRLDYRESLAEQVKANAELKELKKEVKAIRGDMADAADKVAKGVADGVNNAARAGARGQAPR